MEKAPDGIFPVDRFQLRDGEVGGKQTEVLLLPEGIDLHLHPLAQQRDPLKGTPLKGVQADFCHLLRDHHFLQSIAVGTQPLVDLLQFGRKAQLPDRGTSLKGVLSDGSHGVWNVNFCQVLTTGEGIVADPVTGPRMVTLARLVQF